MKASVISTLNVLFTLVLFSQFAYTQTSVSKNANSNDKAPVFVKIENTQPNEKTMPTNTSIITNAFDIAK